MSDTLISQQVSLPMMPDNQLNQINTTVSRADLSMPNILEGSMEPLRSNPIPLSSIEHRPLDSNPTLNTSVGQEMLTSYNLNRQSGSTPNNVREAGQTQSMKPNSITPISPTANKRKATELIPDNRSAVKMSVLSRRGPIGKVVQLESVKNKSQSTVSKKNTQPQIPSKASTNFNDSVRAKLRESLASALALVSSQPQESSSDGKMKTEESPTIVGKGVEEQPLVSFSNNNTPNPEPRNPGEACTSSTPFPNDGFNAVNSTLQGMQLKEISEEATPTWNYMGTSFPSNSILCGEDVSFGDTFFFKDELLQGNGLTWELEHIEKPVMLPEEVVSPEKEQIIQSPEAVAFEIEAKLFKLYGSANKKYKEKGRSLLFNLKDRNNPELREKVMSGEITPERLCSMTAEELASKELSDWRIAKAEELALMKVLPDSEPNMRRLVKKTHKGEYTVDLDPSFDAMEEIPSAASVSSQNRPRSKSARAKLTIPSDGADMQGLMVDDVEDLPPIVTLDEFFELFDKEPPFESLSGGTSHESNAENVPSGTNHESKKNDRELGSESLSPVQASKDCVETTPHKTDDVVVDKRTDVLEVDNGTKKADGLKSTDTPKGSDTNNVTRLPKGEHVWEGLLQISLSSMANFAAFYISGEKTSTKEWPNSFEIKGRVKLDAFDKFVQALPLSRSRAIMVTHLMLKEDSTEGDRASFLEVVESYIMDQRLGFAEPAPGLELYLCPPHSKSVDVIFTHLSKTYTDKLKHIDNGLIGLLVWRKLQITPSPIRDNDENNPISTPRGHHQNVETNMTNKNMGFPSQTHPNNPVYGDDEDDAPPGFGPPGQATRDDDDLPEFNFSRSSNPVASRVSDPNLIAGRHLNSQVLAPTKQVEQMRELIQKYGQNGNNTNIGSQMLPTQRWNDDDDDIPEWQPQAPVPQVVALPPPPPPVHNPNLGFQQHRQYPAQQALWAPPMQPHRTPVRVPQQGAWWPYGPTNTPDGGYQGSSSSSSDRRRPNNRGF